jgi:hypothetical protein
MVPGSGFILGFNLGFGFRFFLWLLAIFYAGFQRANALPNAFA